MTVQSPSVFERLTHTFGEWLDHRREIKEMRQLSSVEFDRIAQDLQISPAAPNQLVNQGPHAADELPKLLTALGSGANDLAQIEPIPLFSGSLRGACHRALISRDPLARDDG